MDFDITDVGLWVEGNESGVYLFILLEVEKVVSEVTVDMRFCFDVDVV